MFLAHIRATVSLSSSQGSCPPPRKRGPYSSFSGSAIHASFGESSPAFLTYAPQVPGETETRAERQARETRLTSADFLLVRASHEVLSICKEAGKVVSYSSGKEREPDIGESQMFIIARLSSSLRICEKSRENGP